jgi:hypothetical protein
MGRIFGRSHLRFTDVRRIGDGWYVFVGREIFIFRRKFSLSLFGLIVNIFGEFDCNSSILDEVSDVLAGVICALAEVGRSR